MNKKIENFWYYHKIYIIVGIIIAVVFAYLIYISVTAKDTAMNFMCINMQAIGEEGKLENKMANAAKIDLSTAKIVLNDSMYLNFESPDLNSINNQEKIFALIAAGTLDGIITDEDTFWNISTVECFYDLRECMNSEQLEKYRPCFYYIDRAEYLKQEDAFEDVETNYVFPKYNPRTPELMEDPIAIGIYLGKDTYIMEEYDFLTDNAVVGIIQNTSHLTNMIDSLETFF